MKVRAWQLQVGNIVSLQGFKSVTIQDIRIDSDSRTLDGRKDFNWLNLAIEPKSMESQAKEKGWKNFNTGVTLRVGINTLIQLKGSK